MQHHAEQPSWYFRPERKCAAKPALRWALGCHLTCLSYRRVHYISQTALSGLTMTLRAECSMQPSGPPGGLLSSAKPGGMQWRQNWPSPGLHSTTCSADGCLCAQESALSGGRWLQT
jgi:hypothetical protein